MGSGPWSLQLSTLWSWQHSPSSKTIQVLAETSFCLSESTPTLSFSICNYQGIQSFIGNNHDCSLKTLHVLVFRDGEREGQGREEENEKLKQCFFFYFFQNWLWWLKRSSKFSVSHGWRTNSLAVEGAKLCSPVGRTSTHPSAFHKPWASFGGCGARILASTKQHSPTRGSSLPSPKGPSKDASVAMGQWERWQKKKKKKMLFALLWQRVI